MVAIKFSMKTLEAKAGHVLYNTFEDISKNEEFKKLNIDELSWLLDSSTFQCKSERYLLNAVASWMAHCT